ncbi:Uncharacterised protein [Acinetobacter baumannii]|nr:Uncharacterised protein [Acinetobacter baumannii]
MGVTLAVLFEVVAVAAGGADAVTVQIHQRLHCVFTVGRLLERHPPGFALAVDAARRDRAAYRHQVVGNAVTVHQAHQLIGAIAFAQRREIDIHARQIFLQPLPAIVADQLQVLQADVLLRRVDLRLFRHLDRMLVWAEPPQVHQWADGDVHGAAGIAADALGHQYDVRHAARDRLRLEAGAAVKPRQHRIGAVGRDIVVGPFEHRVDLPLQLLFADRDVTADLNAVEGAHGLAVDIDLRARGGIVARGEQGA